MPLWARTGTSDVGSAMIATSTGGSWPSSAAAPVMPASSSTDPATTIVGIGPLRPRR